MDFNLLQIVICMVLVLFGAKNIHDARRKKREGVEQAAGKSHKMHLVLGVISVLAGILGILIYGFKFFA